MLRIKKIDNKKMDLNEILNYIKLNTTGKVSKESYKDEKNENNELISRKYTVENEYGIREEFFIEFHVNDLYLTHTTENPNQNLELEDDDIC